MLSLLLRKLFPTAAYVQVAPDRITVRNVLTGLSVSEVPNVAFKNGLELKYLAHGANASLCIGDEGVKTVNPFGHPRTIVSDFSAGEFLIRSLLKQVTDGGLLTSPPFVVIHPLGNPEGGFTSIERRALREMAFGAGAGEVTVWVGRQLTDHEVSERRFPNDTEGQS